MRATTPALPRILAIHPTSHCLGWMILEGPLSAKDWGTKSTRGRNKNLDAIRKTEAIIERYQPDTLVLESYDPTTTLRSTRINRLCRALTNLAMAHGMNVEVYTRDDVRTCFASVGAFTRQEIADAVSTQLSALRSRLPKPRRPWDREDERMSIFSAAALGLTHYHLGANQLFESLKDAA